MKLVFARVTDASGGGSAVVYLGSPPLKSSFPAAVERVLSGPQGRVVEEWRVEREDGRVVFRSPPRTLALPGEHMELALKDVEEGIPLPGPGRYRLVVSVDGRDIGEAEFEAVESDPPTLPPLPPPLEQGISKSTILWVRYRAGREERTVPVWHGYADGRIYLLSGPGEQSLPDLDRADRAHLLVRSKDKGSLLGAVEAAVREVSSAEVWEKVGPILLGRRLNLPDGEQALDRWKKECRLFELVPLPLQSAA